MSNPCSGCESSCCTRFSISTELLDREKYQQILIDFPFIRQVGIKRTEIRTDAGIIRVRHHIHSCDRFILETGECLNYDTEPRPQFCLNAGVIGFKPNLKCLLNPTPFENLP